MLWKEPEDTPSNSKARREKKGKEKVGCGILGFIIN
jgi:hypothetical protein